MALKKHAKAFDLKKYTKKLELEIGALQKEVTRLRIRVKNYETAPRAILGATGGWWYVKKRPKGKGSVKKQGIYLRDPNQL